MDVAIGLPYLRSFALTLGSVVLSAVAEMPFADSMSRVDFEPALLSHQRQVIRDPHAVVVKKYVVVGAQAEYVIRCVWPVVRGPERPDVRGFRVGSG